MVIDNCSVIGDAAIQLDGLDVKVGATSTIPVVYMLAGLLAQTCENLLEQGHHAGCLLQRPPGL